MASKTASGMAGENGSAAKGRRDPVDGEVQQEQQPFSWSDMNLRQKTKHAVANITVEPITLMYVVPNLLSSLTTQNLNLDKACRVNHNLSTELCDSFLSRDNFTEESDLEFTKVAQTVAAMQVWQAPLQNIIPIVLVLFAGSWSDRRRRRKPFILLPVFGDLLMAIGLLFCSIFFSVPLEVAGVIEAIFPALSGGLTILLLSVFSYIADVTTEDTRTFRIGLVATAVSWGAPVAIALSGIAFNNLGFTGVYILDIVIYGLALAYGISYVKEPFPPVSRPAGVSFLGDFCNWRHVWETAKVVLRKRAGSRQLQFFLIVLLYVTIQGPLQGESAVSFLFVTTRFKWDAIQYSAYGTYSIILLAVGNFVVITVLSRWLKLHDCTIGMIAMAAKTLSSPLYAFSTKDWELYAVTVADVLGAGAVIAMRSIATKLVSNDEVGKLMALLAVVEAIIPVIFKPIYSEVYRVSSSGHSGSFYHISAAVCLAGFFLFFFIFRLQKKDGDEGDEAAQVADGGVTNTAFQGDVELATKVSNGNGVDNTAL